MTFLVDTNVISEIRKGKRCDPQVSQWYDALKDEDLHLSTLVLGEIRKGIELARPRNPQKAEALERWLDKVRVAFRGRILGVDLLVAEEWGRMNAVRTLPIIDGLLAATAKANDLTLVTRNVEDIRDTGVRYLNPFEPPEPEGS